MTVSRGRAFLETCLMCERLAPERYVIARSPDVFGHERAPAQQRLAPLCTKCHGVLLKAGERGLVEVASGARWTLVPAAQLPTPALPQPVRPRPAAIRPQFA